jgi:hypothetical protein
MVKQNDFSQCLSSRWVEVLRIDDGVTHTVLVEREVEDTTVLEYQTKQQFKQVLQVTRLFSTPQFQSKLYERKRRRNRCCGVGDTCAV